eukprot:TRINITY_DN1125_c0_g1_i2.p1 TRINITY_DN1125_c0_g1~~TRINITY_DN1125_c0_g1_i2.p1  ORF type:complete len:713 (+),score=222.83 TRINITY_DN1125_c0_g1_i2:82-2220(+)
METLAKLATCNLGQWALDFDVNLNNIIKSIQIAKASGCTLRTGPELEVSGYGCEDHFLEQDTFLHSWESIEKIIKTDLTDGILCDFGMPVLHKNIRYNCRVFVLNRQIILIRPKIDMCDDGNYRESRWFTPWRRLYEMDDYLLPIAIQRATNQKFVPFGNAILVCNDTALAVETCEELFTPQSPHIQLSLNGAEIFVNGSGSHHNLRKLDKRLDLIRSATDKSGGVYLYANQQGCDGGRLYYDGCALIAKNGELLAQGSQFSVQDVEVVTAVVDLEEVRSFRAAISSRNKQASGAEVIPSIKLDFNICPGSVRFVPTPPMRPRLHTAEEEIAYGPACWLWDFLRRSGAGGFFLPLSGGADSSATAAMVGVMCNLVVRACALGDAQVIADARRVVGEPADSSYVPSDPREFCNRFFHTCYMGTENSSSETRERSAGLANDLGSYHLDTNIDPMVAGMLTVFESVTGKRPQFKIFGGSVAENLALQNIQARMRMVFSYLLAQLLPWVRNRPGFLLVLGSANVDEALRGYMTKYDCSSADINPIGGICKKDLKSFLRWTADNMGYTSLYGVISAPASAELEPRTEDYKQVSEEDMGMSFEELSVYGKLRKIARCGPVSMFEKVRHLWTHLSPTQVATKVKDFFRHYSINRHKVTTLTPSYHAENYSPEDNRYDHRQFLYNTRWPRQFETIDRLASASEEEIKEDEATARRKNGNL